MTRSFHRITCAGETLAATFDSAPGSTGLLIVSGGNEIRSGAHGGMAGLAARVADHGFPVLRYDRRGIGESTGQNKGFLESAAEIAAATEFLRQQSKIQNIVAFGNCDAATALALFGPGAGIDRYILANPWVIETTGVTDSFAPTISAAAIRSRYWERIKNPATLLDLLSGKINFRKLFQGLKQASRSEEPSALSLRLRDALSGINRDTMILLAKRDTTARAFLAAWNGADFKPLHRNTAITVESLDSASHSFADIEAKTWLAERLLEALRAA